MIYHMINVVKKWSHCLKTHLVILSVLGPSRMMMYLKLVFLDYLVNLYRYILRKQQAIIVGWLFAFNLNKNLIKNLFKFVLKSILDTKI